jgi:hypothetical protein
MVKKKDTLIEEAEKIKADLDALRKKKKILDRKPTKKRTTKKKPIDGNRTCKGICKKFKVKKPTSGSRYGVGQGRCQTCDVWIDYRGAHLKEGSPAVEDTLGWFCNCCNYRIRQKPRNKVYKEKLAADITRKGEAILSIKKDGNNKEDDVTSIQNRMGIVLLQIKYEEEEIKRYEKIGIKKLLSRISRGNKSKYEYLKTSIQNKKYELTQLELKLRNNMSVQNAVNLQASGIEEEITNKKQRIKKSEKESMKQTNQNRPKLASKQIDDFINSKNLTNSQPYTSVLTKFVKLANQFTEESITDIFENRYKIGIKSENTARNQRSIINHFEKYLKSKNSQHEQDIINKIKESDESLVDTDTINRLISDALFMIRKNSPGIYEDVLRNELNISENEFKQILPKLTRLEEIVEELEDWDDGVPKKVLRSVAAKSENLSDEDMIRQEIKEIEKHSSKRIEKEKTKRVQAPEIEKITTKMVEEYLQGKHNIIKQLKFTVIAEYQKYRSLLKIYELHPDDTKERIRRHVITDLRLPLELKTLENEGGLHPNPICSIIIALYATDYFHWDGENGMEREVIELSKNISRYLQSDIELNRLFQGKK